MPSSNVFFSLRLPDALDPDGGGIGAEDAGLGLLGGEVTEGGGDGGVAVVALDL